MTPDEFRLKLGEARGCDAADTNEAWERFTNEVCAALARSGGTPSAEAETEGGES